MIRMPGSGAVGPLGPVQDRARRCRACGGITKRSGRRSRPARSRAKLVDHGADDRLSRPDAASLGHGVHRYYFRLYALNTRLTVESGLTKKAILNEMGRHILGEGQLMGTYQR